MKSKGFALSIALIGLGIVSVIVLATLQWSQLTEKVANAPSLQLRLQQQRLGLVGPFQAAGSQQPSGCPEQYASWQAELLSCQLDVSAGSSQRAGQLLYRRLVRSVQTMEE